MKFSSKVVIMTTSDAESDENFFKLSFPFQFWHGATVVIKMDQIGPMDGSR